MTQQAQAQRQQVTGLSLEDILADINGAEFASIDTLTIVPLNKTLGGRGTGANPHHGKVFKRTEGIRCMVYTNKNSNAYENMVKRRLVKEGQDPEQFQLGERAFGKRIENTCFIEHTLKGETVPQKYLEVICIGDGPKLSEYLLVTDRGMRPIAKDEIIGLKPESVNPDSQGGLEDKVIIRTFRVENVKRIRTDKKEYLLG